MALNTTVAGLESNSYVTVEFADEYIQANLEASDWLELPTSQKEQLLIKAALMLEDYKYSGDRTVVGQSLAFPRVNLYKYEDKSQPVAFNIVPYQIKNAQCELALWMFLSKGVDEYSSVNMAGLSVSKGFESDKNKTDIPEIVFILIKPFFKNIVNSAMISVTRACVNPDEVVERSASISGVATFVGLLDTPNSYTDSEGKFVRVNEDGSALEFVDGVSNGEMPWGNITGSLYNQTDLQDALDSKLDSNPALASITNTGDGTQFLADDGTYKTVSTSGTSESAWGGITGNLSDQTDLQNALNAKADTTALHTHADLAAVEKVVDNGDGTKFLADDGLYKTVSTGSGNVSWGSVLGTISNQTDLQNVLDAKSSTSHTHSELHTHSNKTLLDNVTTDNLHTHSNKSLIDSITNSGSATSFLAGDGTYKVPYTHPSGDGNLHVPATGTTNNGKVLTAGSTAGSLSWTSISTGSAEDIAYDATSWDGNVNAPTKNVIRDKIVAMDASISAKASLTGIETLSNKTFTGISETATTVSIFAGVLTLDCSLGNVFIVNLDQNITSITFSNVPSSGKAFGITLKLIAGSSAHTVTWGSAVKWPAATAPTISGTSGAVDVIVMFTHDAGTTWYSFVAGQVMA